MMATIQELDYRYILIDKYKYLGLNENEVMIILSIDNILKHGAILVTADTLALKMSLGEKEIDQLIVKLSDPNNKDKCFIEYVTKNDQMVTSLEPTFKKIEAFYTASIEDRRKSEQYLSEEQKENIFTAFETAIGSSLTRLDIDKIMEWIQSGIDDKSILSALEECAMKNKKVTVRLVDKILLKRLIHNDREKEGYSTIDERHRNDIEKAIDIASYHWTDDEK